MNEYIEKTEIQKQLGRIKKWTDKSSKIKKFYEDLTEKSISVKTSKIKCIEC